MDVKTAQWLYNLINTGDASFSPSGRLLVDNLSGEVLLDANDGSVSSLLQYMCDDDNANWGDN